MKILLVAGARPNFIKIAPMVHEIDRSARSDLTYKLVHTGQHYDYKMSKTFFNDLDIPEPDYFLNAGSGTHAEQTAQIMVKFEKVCKDEKPDIVTVVGDVNSTIACTISAKKLNIKVAHIEAGLRSGDMSMPEEINRIVTDSISDYLFVSEKSGVENLKREGKKDNEIYFVGNIIIDTLFSSLEKLSTAQKPERIKTPYTVVTLHRPSNVDNKERLEDIILALKEISLDMDVYFPVHPRTMQNIERFNLRELVNSHIKITPPKSYIDFLSLWKDASLLLTDSGGIQEETTALGIPCFTIRENTERPITIDEGTNTLVGISKHGILNAYKKFRQGDIKKGGVPDFWDGMTAKRIVNVLKSQ